MNKKLKSIGKKILISILILFTINNCILGPNRVLAATDGFEQAKKTLEGLLNAVIGILTLVPRMMAAGLILAVDELTAKVAYVEGDASGNQVSFWKTITPYDIFFNDVKLLDINFFKTTGMSTDSMVYKLRQGVATWYYIMRNLSAAVLLAILIYVGIRMAISTIASERAKYQKMLVDWVTSMAILFLLQYIILFTVYINTAFVNVIKSAANTPGDELRDAYGEIAKLAVQPFGGIEGIAGLVIYGLLTWQTLGLLFAYFNRMIKCAFLIIISPLITITYSIDKMGDSKAQALGNWLREYVFTVLIQPFHCVMYVALVGTAFKLLVDAKGDNSKLLSRAILAIMCVMFIKSAEKIIRKIFAFADDNSKTSMAAGLAATHVALNQAQNIGTSARTAINSVRNFGANLGENAHNARVGLMANAAAIGGAMSGGDEDLTYRERVERAKTDIEADYAQRAEDKLGDDSYRYTVQKNEDGTYSMMKRDKDGNLVKDEELQRAIQEKMKAHPEMSYARAAARARAERAQAARKKKKAEESARKHPRIASAKRTISTAAGAVRRIKSIATNSTLVQMSKSMAVATVAGTGELARTESFGQATIAAYGGYKGAKAFFSSSTNTLTEDAYASLRAMGVNDKYQANDMMREIMNQADMYSDGSDEMRDILNNIKKELKALGADEKYVDNIKYAIQKNIKQGNPISTGEVLTRTLNNINSANGLNIPTSGPEIAGLAAVVGTLGTFENKKNVLSQMQKADSVGINETTFMNEVTKFMGRSQSLDGRRSGASSEPARNYSNVSVEDVEQSETSTREDIIHTIDESRRKELSDAEIDALDFVALNVAFKKMREQEEKNARAQDKNLAYGGRDAALDKETEILRKNIEKMAERILQKEATEILRRMEKNLSEDALGQLRAATLDIEKVKQLYQQKIGELDREEQRLKDERTEIKERSETTENYEEIRVQLEDNTKKITELVSRRNLITKNFNAYENPKK